MLRPPKIQDLMGTIKTSLELGRFLDTIHANKRIAGRQITRSEVLYVLRHGHHEKRKDKFDDEYKAWNYSIRGRTIDKVELRVIISFNENGMLIITVIKLR